MRRPLRPRLVWFGLLASTTFVLSVAVLTPLFPVEVQSVLRWAFAPVCHQLPARSPHIGGLPIAICDRCTGIYAGVVLGVLIAQWTRPLWGTLGAHRPYVLIGSVIPVGLDWIGPMLGLWNNVPQSRALTGFAFGIVAASFVTDRLLQKAVRSASDTGSTTP